MQVGWTNIDSLKVNLLIQVSDSVNTSLVGRPSRSTRVNSPQNVCVCVCVSGGGYYPG